MAIPKIINYVWIGPDNEKLKSAVSQWHSAMPDYQIKKWNLNNWDRNFIPFVEDALRDHQYAYVADVMRLDILFQHGGWYLDTDVTIENSLDAFTNNNFVIGRDSAQSLSTAVIGSSRKNSILHDLLDLYNNAQYSDIKTGKFPRVNNEIITKYIYSKYNHLYLKNIVQIFGDGSFIAPKEYFTFANLPWKKHFATHHFDGSWHDKKTGLKSTIKRIIIFLLPQYVEGQIRSRLILNRSIWVNDLYMRDKHSREKSN